MCGICGVVSRNGVEQNSVSLIEQMNETLNHRGPDDSGVYKDRNIFLAMRRLSIIDVSGGAQPLFNETKTIALIANAEIYNYLELSAELKKQGHVFKTKNDCETIVHLYEEKGLDCLEDLRGMFAFALWDASRRKLFLARDRMGEKPLYLYERDGILIFSSELKALLQIIPEKFSLGPSAVDFFFHYQYVPEPMTPIKDIRKLPSAHYLEIDLRKWNTKPKSYWNPLGVSPIDSEPVASIRKELDYITSLTLRSDVPVGISLSGGIDSGAIAALTAPKYKNRLQAFTVGYSGTPDCDEREMAQAFAHHLGIPFYSRELSTDNFVNSFPELIFACDDPVADIAAYGYFSVMRLAKEHGIKVMLSGFGGDELFWGYPWVRNAVEQSRQKLKTISGSRNKPFNITSRIRYLVEYGRAPKNQMIFYDLDPHFQWAVNKLPALYEKKFKTNIFSSSYDLFRAADSWEPLDLKIPQLLFGSWLASNCIVLGDRLSMASSIELRLPLLDYRLVELIFGLRKSSSDLGLAPKAWFKEAIRGLLPDEVLGRNKQGFSPPEQEWLEAILNNYKEFVFNGYLVENKFFNRRALEKYFSAAAKNTANLDLHLAYKIILLEIWCRLFLWKMPSEEITKEA